MSLTFLITIHVPNLLENILTSCKNTLKELKLTTEKRENIKSIERLA